MYNWCEEIYCKQLKYLIRNPLRSNDHLRRLRLSWKKNTDQSWLIHHQYVHMYACITNAITTIDTAFFVLYYSMCICSRLCNTLNILTVFTSAFRHQTARFRQKAKGTLFKRKPFSIHSSEIKFYAEETQFNNLTPKFSWFVFFGQGCIFKTYQWFSPSF